MPGLPKSWAVKLGGSVTLIRAMVYTWALASERTATLLAPQAANRVDIEVTTEYERAMS